jgi:multiple sugar transport system permease protein
VGSGDVMDRPEDSNSQKGSQRARRVKHRSGFFFLAAPGVVFYTLAVLIPLALAVSYSFRDYNILSGRGGWIGLANYAELLNDSDFWGPFIYTLTLTVFVAVVANVFGVALAAVLNRPQRVFHWLRTITFVPVILAGVVIAYLWSTILTDQGILNTTLASVGLDGLQQSWLGSTRGAQLSVMIVSVWPAIGFCTVVYLAGFQAIPQELIEAAQIDGASPRQVFRRISWPLLQPALLVNTPIMMINGFKAYDISLVLTGGGPVGATETAALRILRVGVEQNRAGYASAAAVALLLAVGLTAFFASRLARRAER